MARELINYRTGETLMAEATRDLCDASDDAIGGTGAISVAFVDGTWIPIDDSERDDYARRGHSVTTAYVEGEPEVAS